MVSYFKTQWFHLLVALFCLVMCCVYIFSLPPDTTTIESLDKAVTNLVIAGSYFLGFIIWLVMSFINHLQDRIELLESKAEKYDDLCELVEELTEANKLYSEIMNTHEERRKKQEDELIAAAIRAELARGGQIYYLHNRVETIDQCASALVRRIPGLQVAVAHGKMGEEALGEVMTNMAAGEIQCLVCTTIIETGLDIPNANTLIIENADRFGLSQLHQLRGRVGRSTRHAYAYFTYKPDKSLSEVAEKRLAAIRDFAEFGSGFKIAMRDLEIRGAGNVLGAEQSGHMEAVGYELYCKLLNEAVRRLKGEPVAEQFETSVEIDMDAYIPLAYIRNEAQKLDIYKRISHIETQEEFEDMQDELIDRFGDMPKEIENLLEIARIKKKQ